MLKFFSARLAGNLLIIGFVLLALFDVLILVGIAPSSVVMGGAVQNTSGSGGVLIVVALLVTLFFIFLVAAKLGYVQVPRLMPAINIGIWLIFVYLLLNTLGNVASGVTAENIVFAPLTVVLAICALRLALEKKAKRKK
jgi:hypothetical protein